ncbi:MAG: hypothetical protein NDI69_07110 [Bacteriovoracaceae bacterium]|nr:hypothetical protein [Bacteriovoracaceae bacterium]
MRTNLFLLFMTLLSILGASCTKEVKYSKEALFKKAQDAEPSVTVILPKNLAEGIHCSEYSEGCLAGHTVRVKNLDMIAVEFNTEAEAIYAAKKFRGYYFKNWLFDDVTGEPELEKFVVEILQAKKP